MRHGAHLLAVPGVEVAAEMVAVCGAPASRSMPDGLITSLMSAPNSAEAGHCSIAVSSTPTLHDMTSEAGQETALCHTVQDLVMRSHQQILCPASARFIIDIIVPAGTLVCILV